MKGTFFSKPLEWNIETREETWQQNGIITGTLKVTNHGADSFELNNHGVAIAYADVKKVHAKTEGILVPSDEMKLPSEIIPLGGHKTIEFSLTLPENCPITDKKSSWFLSYGKNSTENHLMLNVGPLALFTKIIGLLDTFQRFKVKEVKAAKSGVEFKLTPPTSREFANLESLSTLFSLKDKTLKINYEFQVKKLDTDSPVTKLKKEVVKLSKELTEKEYLLGRDMINQDQILKSIESALKEVKLNGF